MVDNLKYYTYILFSQKVGKYYVGQTENVVKRVQDHRAGLSKWTSNSDDWVLVYSIELNSRKEAIQQEKRIKKRGAGRWLIDENLNKFRDVAQSG